MPNYADPRIYEIISHAQLEALQAAGYMLVPEKDVREVIRHTDWIDDLISKAVNVLEERYLRHPNSHGIYHLEHRLEIFFLTFLSGSI